MDTKCNFIKNGFIVQSYEELIEYRIGKYQGIGRYLTWPLDDCHDSISRDLEREATKKWLGYWDNRLQVVPDLEYLRRYVKHCRDLGIEVFCLQIESQNSILRTEDTIIVEEFLGYDYVDIDMNTSILMDELDGIDEYYYKYFAAIESKLNKYGLLSNIQDMKEYICKHNEFVKEFKPGVLEEYISPMVIKVSKICL